MNVSNDELKEFDKGFHSSLKRLGDGKVAIDSNLVRQLVRQYPKAASRYVEMHCVMAQSQPGYLQPALIVAGAYQIEFNDDCLMEMVTSKADKLGAEDDLKGVQFMRDIESFSKETPEREAAREWWRRTGREDGRCDNCAEPIRRGQGYLIKGRRMMMGDRILEMGEELICSGCYTKLVRREW